MTMRTSTLPDQPFEADFGAALIDPDRAVPSGIIAARAGAVRRFAVYRNNVVTGLIDAVRARFPAVECCVGEEFMVAMAHVYVRAHPPRSPMMFRYGDGFARFIEDFPPAREIVYLADLARVEAARSHAFHAADAEPLDAARLARLAPGALLALEAEPHPSVTIVRSRHPIVTLWAMNSGVTEPAAIAPWTAEDAVIARPFADTIVQRLRPGGAAVLDALRRLEDGKAVTLGAAMASAAARVDAFDPMTVFGDLLRSGLLIAARQSPQHGDRMT